MTKPYLQIGLGIALGAGIGTALSVPLGSGGLWLGVGIPPSGLLSQQLCLGAVLKENAPTTNDHRLTTPL